MTDTPPQIEKLVRELIMARSGEERMIMGSQMFDAAVEMIRSSLPPGLSEREQRRRIFLRLYNDTELADKAGL